MQRLELQHSIFLRAIRRAIPQFAPGPGEVRILECGGGGMDWVIDVAEAVPNCQASHSPLNISIPLDFNQSLF